LREREGDVLVLAEYFLRTLGERMGRRQSRLGGHLGIGGHGSLAAGLPSGPPIVVGSAPTTQPLLEVEKQAVVDALRRAKGNKTQATAALGLSRGAFYRRLERFGLVA
jgi:DNA-binding NtrC family response regulator